MKPHLSLLKMCVGEVCSHPGMWERYAAMRNQPAKLVNEISLDDGRDGLSLQVNN